MSELRPSGATPPSGAPPLSGARLFLWTAAMVVAAGLLAPLAEILGDQLAGTLWNALRLSSPWLSQTGILCGGLIGGALVGLLQWAVLPRVRARWMVISSAAGLGIALVYLVYHPLTVVAAPVAAALAAVAQGRLLPHPGRRWLRAQTAAAAWAAMALLLPFPRWAAALLIVFAALISAWGAREAFA